MTLSQGSSSISESGDTTYGGVVSGINENEALAQTLNLQLTGGPGITTRTIESVTSFTSSGLGGNFTETENMGAGLAAGAYVGDQVGDGAYGSAEHLGTTPNGVDNESGLLSALGGVAMHPIAFAGAEILPAIDTAENGVWLEENNQYGQTPTNWISHPSGIGYRRAAPGVASSSGHAAIPPSSGNQPTMDSGLADGDNDEEVNRLENFDSGGNDNTTSPQAGPTSRADQLAMDFAPGGSPAIINTRVGGDGGLTPGQAWFFYGAGDGGNDSPASNGPGRSGGQPVGGGSGSRGGGGVTGPDGLLPGSGLLTDLLRGKVQLPGSPQGPPMLGLEPPLDAPQPVPSQAAGRDRAGMIGAFLTNPGGDVVAEMLYNPEKCADLLDVISIDPLSAFLDDYYRFQNPLLSVQSSQTNDNPTDKSLHYMMQVANVASLADLPVQVANVGRLGFNGLRALRGLRSAEGAKNVLTTLGAGRVGPEFNPQKLQRILSNLERQGVVLDNGADAMRFLDVQGANGMYVYGNGTRGTLILRPSPTRLEVVEELVHHGQHVGVGLQFPTNTAAAARAVLQREVAAQDILLRIANKQNWTAQEIARISTNRERWIQKLSRSNP